ncbi:GTP-binding protein [Anaerotalea alkaliphila]|uniref:GTP-binding protein n=1 Tax=Anaerotalea alkaliphila TaxID=2662126 RepID=A0A7X5HXC1_9FIRM|nr:GTP-binding protein [Anaerotalea alkaliphila]NDL68340.1 GTP-binding protein [Anaerotalea alkaliphila]
MTKLYLVTGFLGAGKTTFLKHLLERIDGQVGLLVNEFGKESIDGITLQGQDLEQKGIKDYAYGGNIVIIDGVYFEREVAVMESVTRQIRHSEIALVELVELAERVSPTDSLVFLSSEGLRAMSPILAAARETFGDGAEFEM